MLTSYSVKCPACDWHGNLLPEGAAKIWKGALPTTSVLVFRCPCCDLQWRDHVTGDDLDGQAGRQFEIEVAGSR